MSRKYQKFGFRRDKNLSDASSPAEALSNLLNDLPTIENETFIPNDLYVINGIRNTKVSNKELKSLANIREVYLNPNTNNLETVRPLINLKDRVDNFKIFTENPIFGSGGNGPLAYFVPLQNLLSINEGTKGDELYSQNSNVIGPIKFWDDGIFVLENRIHPSFTDPYGLVQWRGFFSKELFSVGAYINIRTSGLVKIEQNYTGEPNDWEFLKNIYSDSISVEIISDGNPASSYNVGTQVDKIAINQKITEYENVYVTGIDTENQIVFLSEPITLSIGTNVLTFEFEIGVDEIEFRILPFQSYLNDKIEIRISLWWPDVSNPTITKSFYSDYVGVVDNFNFNYFYSEYSRERLPTSNESIEYFLQNRLSGLNQYTDNNIINQDLILTSYIPPKLASEKIIYPSGTNVTNLGVGKISGTGVFTQAEVGDWILIKPTNVFESKAFQITEKTNNSTVFIKYDSILPVEIGQDFNIIIIKNYGLVGIFYNLGGTIVEFQGMNFTRRKIEKDYLAAGITYDSLNNTNFLKITSFDNTTGLMSVTDFQGGGQSITVGYFIVYQDKGVIDNSKKAFCNGVIGKETTQIANIGTNTITLTDVVDLYNGQYVQYSGFIPENTTITQINSNTITLSNNIIKSIPLGSSVVFSPDNINREVCIIPLNTAPPFEGTDTGLKTSSISPGLWVNDIEFKNLDITTGGSNIEIVGATTTYSETLTIKNNGNNYKILLR